MKRTRFFVGFFLFLTSILSSICSGKINENDIEGELAEIINSKDQSILSILENKIYFLFSKIHFQENGFYLELENGKCLKLPNLSFDLKGYYLPLSSDSIFASSSEAIWDYWRCLR